MPRRCDRPGCSAPAEVAYGFDLDRVVIWLDAVDPELVERVNAAILCRRHADALQPPRGWFLDDRRDARPRLFRPADDASPASGAPRPRSRRRDRRDRTADATEELPLFAADGVAYEDGPSERQVGGSNPAAGGPAAAADGTSRTGPEAIHDTAALPWTPVFDQTDDLGGVLDARGPLLARAFGNRGRPR